MQTDRRQSEEVKVGGQYDFRLSQPVTFEKGSSFSERGSITLFTAVIVLPVLFFLLTISLDLTQLYANRTEMQRLIDEAAMQGYRYLPFTEQARRAVDTYLRQLSTASGAFETIVSSNSIEVNYRGVAPFSFSAFVGRETGIPYELSTRVRGTVVHASLVIDSNASLVPRSDQSPWGAEALWPAARLFTHFSPFGEGVSARMATQQCFNPIFSGLKRSALRLFDYLTSFSKNSLAVSFVPGTLSPIDTIKDARRPGNDLTEPVVGYFNIANGPISRNSYCLAITEDEPLDSPYRLPENPFTSSGSDFDGERITDRETYTVPETSLELLSAREVIWSRGSRAGSSSIKGMLSHISASLSHGGELNSFELQNRLADKPAKVGIILSTDLPQEANTRFPSDMAKNAVRDELQRFWRLLGGETADQSVGAGSLYYVILQTPEAPVNLSHVEELQSFFNQQVEELGATGRLAARVVYSSNPEELAAGVVRSLVLESNTAVIDR